jgi:hypothetical protein
VEARKRARLFPIAVALVIAYVVGFPNPAGRDLVVRPAWSVRLDSAPLTARRGTETLGFRVGGEFGYVNPSGELFRLEQVAHDVTFNDLLYANYAKSSESILLRRADGTIATLLDGG